MIKLDEQDIKAVASGRFYRRYGKGVGVLGLSTFAGCVVLATVTNHIAPIFVYFVVICLGFIYTTRKLRETVRELTEQWKKEGVS